MSSADTLELSVPVPSPAEGSVNFVQLNEQFDAWTKQCEADQASKANDNQSMKDAQSWLQKPSVGTWLGFRLPGDDDAHEQCETSVAINVVQNPAEEARQQGETLTASNVAPVRAPVAAASPAKKCTPSSKDATKASAHGERHASPLASANRVTSPRVVKPASTAAAVAAKNPPSPTKQPRLSAAVPTQPLATSKSFDARRPSPAKEHGEVQKKAPAGTVNKALLQRKPSPAKDRAPMTSTPSTKDKADKTKSDSPKMTVAATPRVASKPQTAAEQHATPATGRAASVGKGTSPRVHRPSQPPAVNGVDKKVSAPAAQTPQRSKSPPAATQASVLPKKKQLSSAELEAQALEEKRQELRKLSEQNARRMARMSAVNPQVLKVSTPARSQTSINRAPTPQSALAGLRRQSAGMQKSS